MKTSNLRAVRSTVFVGSGILLGTFSLLAQPTPYPCKTSAACLFVGPTGTPQGWIAGEIRAFAFGGDSRKVIDELAAKGWVECAGQSAIRKDFDELWRVVGTEWGSADKTNVFFLPDFRGLFLRDWNHNRTPPPQHTDVPFSGDVDQASRISPRPEAGEANGDPGATGDHVGSLQPPAVGPHDHYVGNKAGMVGGPPGFEITYNSGWAQYGHFATDSGQNGVRKETRPSNAYILYLIYVGKAAAVVEPTVDQSQTGATARLCRAGDQACLQTR